MQFDREAMSPRRLEDLPALGWSEDSGLAEDVAALRQTFACDGGDHFLTQELHVGSAITAVFGWDLMRAEERRHQRRRKFVSHSPDHPKLLQLRFQLESAASLHLDRRSAVGRQL